MADWLVLVMTLYGVVLGGLVGYHDRKRTRLARPLTALALTSLLAWVAYGAYVILFLKE